MSFLEKYKNNRIVCTSYMDPDLDGFACSWAMSEYLNSIGFNTLVGLRGKPHPEAEFVIKFLDLDMPHQFNDVFKESDKVVLLDASEIIYVVDDKIDINNIVGIIDHRKAHDGDKFINAEVQIELVGSAATLVAEKFFNNELVPSRDAAVLLYSAIVSNTINFKNNVTTERDKKMAEWLLSMVDLPADYIRQMFVYKTNRYRDIYDKLMSDYDVTIIDNVQISVMQLEIVGAEQFVKENQEEILKTLDRIRQENGVNYIFLTCIDVIDGYNIFITSDDAIKDVLIKLYQVKFDKCYTKREGIIMRKEIKADIKELNWKF